MIAVGRRGCPASLSERAAAATEVLARQLDAGEKLEFDASVYAARDVKDALVEAQHGKCAFCESAFLHVAYGDVEHFRPKAAVCQESEPPTRPGYWWLAYEWTNLLVCCAICNRRFKRNAFPLRSPDTRATDADGLAGEEPLFVDPSVDDPAEHIGWHGADPVALTERGKATIAALDLACVRDDRHREVLRDRRRQRLELVRVLRDALGTPLPDDVRERFEQILARNLAPVSEYLAMTRAAL